MKKITREELFKADRGEREYYQSKRSLKERIRLPITLDGCEALLEIVTSALDLPLDDTTRQVFCGHVHHLPPDENSTTLGELGKVLYKNMANAATWRLDQDTKERLQAQKEQARKDQEAEVKRQEMKLVKEAGESTDKGPIAKDANAAEGRPSVQ